MRRLLVAHLFSLSVLGTVALLYLVTATRYVQGGDNGEFATIFAEGGVAHPSGYPLYSIWLRALSWLPAATPAHGAALATAVLSSTALVTLYAAMRGWGAGRVPAAIVLLSFALSREQWLLSTSAEVFAMNQLLAAATLWIAGPGGPLRGGSRAAALAITGGLIPSIHLTGALLLPCFIAGFWHAARESSLSSVVKRLPLALLGLLPWLYPLWVVHAPTGRWVWGEFATLSDLVNHALRREYGVFTMSPVGETAPVTAYLWDLVRHLIVELWGSPLLVLGLIGYLAAHRRWQPLLNVATPGMAFVLAGPLFVAQFNLPLGGPSAAVIARFYILPALLLSVMLALLLSYATQQLTADVLSMLGAIVLTGLLVLAVLFDFDFVLRLNGPQIERYLVDSLESLPKGAVLIGGNDTRLFGILYLQRGRTRRTDVVYISPPLLMRAWYRERLARALSLPLRAPVNDQSYDGPGLVNDLQVAGREVFLMDTNALVQPILDTFPNFPVGTTIRLLRPGQSEPPLAVQTALNDVWYSAHPPPTDQPPAQARWELMARWDYARPLHYLADMHQRQGQIAEAERLRGLARQISGPTGQLAR